MARPTKCRRVEFFPEQTYFAPCRQAGCGGCTPSDQIDLKVEELEAMRLKDLEGLNQDECATRMQISRQTFQNVLDSARKKVTTALSTGKAIRIGGGEYTTKHCQFVCSDCGARYEINYAQDRLSCPQCGSNQVECHKRQGTCQQFCHGGQDDE